MNVFDQELKLLHKLHKLLLVERQLLKDAQTKFIVASLDEATSERKLLRLTRGVTYGDHLFDTDAKSAGAAIEAGLAAVDQRIEELKLKRNDTTILLLRDMLQDSDDGLEGASELLSRVKEKLKDK